jgi:hypothetical protein
MHAPATEAALQKKALRNLVCGASASGLNWPKRAPGPLMRAPLFATTDHERAMQIANRPRTTCGTYSGPTMLVRTAPAIALSK